jgi:hypothetical protein
MFYYYYYYYYYYVTIIIFLVSCHITVRLEYKILHILLISWPRTVTELGNSISKASYLHL